MNSDVGVLLKSTFNFLHSLFEDRYKDIITYSLSGMIVITPEGRIITVNKIIEDIFGYKKKELIGMPIEILVPDEIKEIHPGHVQFYISNPEVRYMGIGRDLYGKHKNGSKVWVEVGLRPVYLNNHMFVISSVTDISYRKKIEEQIREKTNELEEFAYRISHDLKAPLLSVYGLADCITEDLNDKNYSDVAENAKKIKSLTHNLQTMVRKILILTKADLKNEEYKSFDFENYISLAKQKFLKIAKDKKVKIESHFGHEKDLLIQPIRMSQILDNIVSNAIKYSCDERKRKFVKIYTKNDSNDFHIKIEDNGIGIAEEKKDEVFSMFSRFHKDSASGTGLGLYMVQKLVKKMNGEIKLDSSGKGSVFNLKFSLDPKKNF
ncbi:MAG: PAS domain-containing sensor histidine kinase [Halobacteriovoraceae bacterium]|nr:PAS domain-containing sensor histidine kinase [Halobacteriovoraceae bacterium]